MKKFALFALLSLPFQHQQLLWGEVTLDSVAILSSQKLLRRHPILMISTPGTVTDVKWLIMQRRQSSTSRIQTLI
ncbi:Uncharacterised protein [Klebsiella variicola]|uniref:Uncharacterized protein n=1 Tax=Klebsiella variicola TaxID=244366 RepID=A0ABD7P4K5_KLEVA|nr:Uncharacterised protein [Klebsiella variicola]